jgi:hypothetical protein
MTARTALGRAPAAHEPSNRESPFNATSKFDSRYTKLPKAAPHFAAQLSITLLPEFTFQRQAQPPQP